MSWEFAPSFDAAQRAALEAGKPLVYVCPPAGWALAPLLDRLPVGGPGGPAILMLVPEPTDAVDLSASLGWIAALRPLHAGRGTARTERLLRAGAVRTLVTTPVDALALTRRASLKLPAVRHLVVAWPEASLALGDGPTLDALLADAREAQRLLATVDDRDATVTDLLARHAHHAPVAVAASLPPPEERLPELRYLVADDGRRPAVVRGILDQLNPERALLWDPLPSRVARWAELARDPAVRVVTDPAAERATVAVATDLPSHEVLKALAVAAGHVVVLVRPSQLGYLQRIARTLKPVRITGDADQARDRAAELRRRLRERLTAGGLDAELLALAPLFDEHDPALVAAAAAALATTPAPTPAAVGTDESGATIAWVRLLVTAGRRDRVRPADIVGALVNGAGLPKNHIGRIEVRDAFCLVEVRAEAAERALRGLTGATLRGRRVTARPDQR